MHTDGKKTMDCVRIDVMGLLGMVGCVLLRLDAYSTLYSE